MNQRIDQASAERIATRIINEDPYARVRLIQEVVGEKHPLCERYEFDTVIQKHDGRKWVTLPAIEMDLAQYATGGQDA